MLLQCRRPAGTDAAARNHRDADDFHPGVVHALDDLLRASDHLVGGKAAGDVVRAFEENDMRGAGALEHVALDALERRRPIAAIEDAVAGYPLIGNAVGLVFGQRGAARGTPVAPALTAGWLPDALLVPRAARPVGERVA